MLDRIAKQKLDVVLIVDVSTSMKGNRISAVNNAIKDIQKELVEIEKENSNVDFYLTIITFGTDGRFYNNIKSVRIEDVKFDDIKAGGWSNLHCGYERLEEILKKESQGGVMPDFGGIAPILLLLSDGHPTGDDYKGKLKTLKSMPWFKASIRYGLAIELKDTRTIKVLRDFVENSGDVIECFDIKMLRNIIKIIVVTASKVKSTSSAVRGSNTSNPTNQMLKQEIGEALADIDDTEW